MYNYYQFGLFIQSEIKLPVPECNDEGKSTIEIVYGNVPDILSDVIYKGAFIQINRNERLYTFPESGKFLVTQHKITIEPIEVLDEQAILSSLIHGPFYCLMLFNERIPFHGSTVLLDDKAVIFTGPSGSGKSTTAAAFTKIGYNVLADDLCCMMVYEGKAVVAPGFQFLKLWDKSIHKLGFNANDKDKVKNDVEKYFFHLNEKWESDYFEIKRIYELSQVHKDEVQIEKINGFEKFNLLSRNVLLKRFLKDMGLNKLYFEVLKTITSTVELSIINKPRNAFLIDQLVEKVLDDLAHKLKGEPSN